MINDMNISTDIAAIEPMDDTELQGIVSGELEDAVSYIDSDVSPIRAKGTEYYRGDPFGNEEDGRSQVVAMEVSPANFLDITDEAGLKTLFEDGSGTDAPKAAVAAARVSGGPGNTGMYMVDKFTFYTADPSVEAALQVPTISRARDLICSMVGCLTIKQYSEQWNGEYMERIYLPPDTWFTQPDPNVTRNFILSNTASDLLMFGRAFWAITERLGNGFPSKFTWLPAQNIYTLDQSGPQWFGPSNEITFQGAPLKTSDVVQFLSPNGGLIYQGVSAITTALRLQRAAERFATNEIPRPLTPIKRVNSLKIKRLFAALA